MSEKCLKLITRGKIIMENKICSNVRIEKQNWEKLKKIATLNKRSINKEIEYIIEKRIEEYRETLNKKDNK